MRYTPAVQRAVLLWITLSLACGGGGRKKVSTLPLEPMCTEAERYDGSGCKAPSGAKAKVAQARSALANFDVDTALPLLDAATAEGPHEHDLLVQLLEQRGIAYSYLKNEEAALAAFASLLDLSPGHLLSYTLSPQATFLYERARLANQKRAKTLVDVSWPQGLREDKTIPLAIEVVADPAAMLHRMALYVRSSEAEEYKRVALTLPKLGERKSVYLPAPNIKKTGVLQLYGRGYNEKGDEVLLWFDASRPREIPLGYDAPSPWYRKWWVWAAVGGVVAVGTGTTVYLLGLEPSDAVSGGFTIAD